MGMTENVGIDRSLAAKKWRKIRNFYHRILLCFLYKKLSVYPCDLTAPVLANHDATNSGQWLDGGYSLLPLSLDVKNGYREGLYTCELI